MGLLKIISFLNTDKESFLYVIKNQGQLNCHSKNSGIILEKYSKNQESYTRLIISLSTYACMKTMLS